MTPEQWQNVADCARARWYAFRDQTLPRTPGYWERRAGEFDTWMAALELIGRTPF